MKGRLRANFNTDTKQKRLTLVEIAIVLVIVRLLEGLGASFAEMLTKRSGYKKTLLI